MSVKIAGLKVENVKRVQLVELHPSDTGLTVIGGDNRQGKSSVLNSIAVAVGGEKFAPSNPIREGEAKGSVEVTLSNGWVVNRSFTDKGSYLKVTDSKGMKGGQKLLDEVVSAFALDLGKFIELDGKQKTKLLMQASGVDLTPLEAAIKRDFDERTLVGREVTRIEGAVATMPEYPDAKPVDVSALLAEAQRLQAESVRASSEATAKANDAMRREAALKAANDAIARAKSELAKAEQMPTGEGREELEAKAVELTTKASEVSAKVANAQHDNAKVTANQAKDKAKAELAAKVKERDSLTVKIDAGRAGILKLCASMPLEGLAVADGELTYKGQAWDCMSHSEQLVVASSIVRKLNPDCGFVLLDKLEAMDIKTLTAFGAWLEKEGLQAIATRVSTGDECSVIIEDGLVVSERPF